MLQKHQQIFNEIEKAEKILITFPAFWNGDAVASSLAFYLLLKKLGKNADIVSTKDELSDTLSIASSFFSFLPEFFKIQSAFELTEQFVIALDTSETKIQKLKYKTNKDSVKFFITPKNGKFTKEDVSSQNGLSGYDLIISIDSPDLESLGKLFDNNTNLFYNTPIINIDHHSANEEYGQINLINLNAVSTSEIIFSLINAKDENLIDHDIATCLLAGIVIKTKNFKTANITPDTLTKTSALVSKEARREEIVNKIFRSKNIKVLKLWGRILARLSSLKNNKIIWSTINAVDFIKTGTDTTALSDIVEELIINIPEAEVIIIFYEDPTLKDLNGKPEGHLLVHTPKNIDIKNIIKEYKPQGNNKFIKIETKKELKEIKNEIIGVFNKKINSFD